MEKFYDVIIAGAGIAGLCTALSLNSDLKILILAKKSLPVCNTALAQGGIAGVLDFENDSYEYHMNDTLVAGGYRNNTEAVEILVRSGTECLKSLINFGVSFDKNTDGKLNMTLEGGHSKRRILHSKDTTGKEIHSSLVKILLESNERNGNITVAENTALWDAFLIGNNFGIDVLNNNRHRYFFSRKLIIATGGIGMVYKYSTNALTSTGDGIAAARRMGAEIRNLSYIQFHPTAFAGGGASERLLISESVRGEGAYLLNSKFERFMHRYDNRLELAPRDVVSRSIMTEARRSGCENIFLDISHRDSEYIKSRFPMIYSRLLSEGYDMTNEPVPVFPCQHYLMGGINTDTEGRTNIPGLYAVGECAHTGVHGKNRLASNSLLEAAVFGKRVALDINSELGNKKFSGVNIDFDESLEKKLELNSKNEDEISNDLAEKIREIMQESYFVLPDKGDIIEGYEKIQDININLTENKYKHNLALLETMSVASVAEMILSEALGVKTKF